MLYDYALVAYEKDTKFLFISITLSELIHCSLLEILDDELAISNSKKHYIKRKHILDVFRVSGIKMPSHYYYDWYIERVNEVKDVEEIDLNTGDEEDVTKDG